jgi:hypothetical protein
MFETNLRFAVPKLVTDPPQLTADAFTLNLHLIAPLGQMHPRLGLTWGPAAFWA